MAVERLNCVGDICPVPVIKTKKALVGADTLQFQGLEILVDNEIAVQNISKFLNSTGCSFSTAKEGEHFLLVISGMDGSVPSANTVGNNQPSISGNTVVIISSEFMGAGDDALGKILIKGFIFALTQLETLPQAVIFYNSGVRLALKTSESVKDLQYLYEQGVNVLACGTCLNHFNALSDLAVGEVTDMYNIVNLTQQAGRIIRP